jgi:hypothetical protein
MRGYPTIAQLEEQLVTARTKLAEAEAESRPRVEMVTARNVARHSPLADAHARRVAEARQAVTTIERQLGLEHAIEQIRQHPRVESVRWAFRWNAYRSAQTHRFVLGVQGSRIDLLLVDGSRHEVELPPILGPELAELLEAALADEVST